MKPERWGEYLLVEEHSRFDLGIVYKAVNLEGPPELKFLVRFSPELSEDAAAVALIKTRCQHWKEIRDIHTLNLLDFGELGGRLYYVCEFRLGRTLGQMLGRCREEGVPLAPDQAVYLAERLAGAAVSVGTQEEFLGHLSPHQVLITFEGEVRLFPPAIRNLHTTSLAGSPILAHHRAYLPPTLPKGQPLSPSQDPKALALLLFEFICHEPFCSEGPEQINLQTRLEQGAKGLGLAEPPPADIMEIVRKGLDPDHSGAYTDLQAMKSDLDALIASGEYSPTTFNIAFLMHTLFRGQDEQEAETNRGHLSLNRTPFLKAPPFKAPAKAAPSGGGEKQRSGEFPESGSSLFSSYGAAGSEGGSAGKWLKIGGAAAAVIAVAAAGVWFLVIAPRRAQEARLRAQYEAQMAKERENFQKKQQQLAKQLSAAEKQKTRLEGSLPNAKTTEERQQMLDALAKARQTIADQRRQQQALLAKLSSQQESAPKEKNAEEDAAPKPADGNAAASPSPKPSEAAAGKGAGDSGTPSEPPRANALPSASANETAAPGPALQQPPADNELVMKAPVPKPKVKAGAFVHIWEVDIKPKVIKRVSVRYTSLARQHRVEGTVYVTVDIDEQGRVTDAKVIRGPQPDYGLDEACIEAAMKTRYSPAIKDGVPVKTQLTYPVEFQIEQ